MGVKILQAIYLVMNVLLCFY